MFGGTIAGFTLASLTIGISWSPLYASIGAMIGPRGGASVLLGGGIAYGVLAPWLLKTGIVRDADFGSFSKWLVWPALGLLVAGSFVPLLLDVGSLRRSFRDLRSLAGGRAAARAEEAPAARSLGARTLTSLFVVSVLTLVLVGRAAFGVGPAVIAVVVVLALVLTNVSARATGETDVAPVGAVGMITQAAFPGAGVVTSLVTGGVSTATSAQACGTLYAFRAGERLGASTRAQVGAQLVGAVLGAIVVVPVYFLHREELRARNGSVARPQRAVVEGDGGGGAGRRATPTRGAGRGRGPGGRRASSRWAGAPASPASSPLPPPWEWRCSFRPHPRRRSSSAPWRS